jgi:serine protease Do
MNNQEQIVKVIKNALPAVVTITASKYLTVLESPFGDFGFPFEEFFMMPKERKKTKISSGSGFIVDKNGLILTNRHVVNDPQAEYLVVLNDKRKFKAKILAKDPINDVAILKIDAKNLPFLELGDSSKLELGQTAIAIGTALGIFENTVSVGVVSGLSRDITAQALSGPQTKLRGLIQTDAAVNPGNSGGPLLDIEGKVIGINAAMVFLAENIGFALPINNAKKDLEELKKYKRIRQPFLGIRHIPINKRIQKIYNLPINYGALVISEPLKGEAVIKNSPAEKAGIKEFDIILEIDNKKISEKNSLTDLLYEHKIGDKIKLKILRNGKEMNLDLEIGEKKV